MIFDLHCDTIWAIGNTQENRNPHALQKSRLQIDEEKLMQGGYLAQCFALFVPNNAPNRKEKCLQMASLFEEQVQNCTHMRPAYSYADLLKNQKDKKISAVLTMEDGCPLEGDLRSLQTFYDVGVRMICLSWNYPNALGFPNIDASKPIQKADLFTPDTRRGLTDFGKAVVKEMNELGIIVDVSHLSDAGFYDVINTTCKPVVASHSNARAVCGNVRNLTDDMLKKIADVGGRVGVTFVNDFVFDEKKAGETLCDGLVRHIRHVQKVAGLDCIALGSDFDGAEKDETLSGADKLPKLIRKLEEEKFTADEIEKITYRNALRVFADCLKA